MSRYTLGSKPEVHKLGELPGIFKRDRVDFSRVSAVTLSCSDKPARLNASHVRGGVPVDRTDHLTVFDFVQADGSQLAHKS